mmetsp:Transcript_7117/g.14285  ORF Transcript_7117/g.14285 Transcript_7117/m.14285 type:complete len:456 (+) Transcript_7117:99-1466(+)
MPRGAALIVGGTGVAAFEIAPHLCNDFEGDEAFAKVGVLSRSVSSETYAGKLKPGRKIVPVQADLSNRVSIVTSLREAGLTSDIEYVFWFADGNRPSLLLDVIGARQFQATARRWQSVIHWLLAWCPQFIHDRLYASLATGAGGGSGGSTIAWMDNVLEALLEVGANIKVVIMGTGGKHYGMHLGPDFMPEYCIPYLEDVHRAPAPLSYFDQEKYLAERAKRYGFAWDVVRPSFIIGNTSETKPTTQSLALVIAIYAAIMKHQGKPLVFPGPPRNWQAGNQLTSSRKIAHISGWLATNGSYAGLINAYAGKSEVSASKSNAAHLANQKPGFNAVSCPAFCWATCWGPLAQSLGMKATMPVGPLGTPVLELLGGLHAARAAWQEIVSEHKLSNTRLDNVFSADFFDKSFSMNWDCVFSTQKLSDAGYPESLLLEHADALSVFQEAFADFRAAGLIP